MPELIWGFLATAGSFIKPEKITWAFICVYSRFPLGRLRSSISSGKQVPLKSHCLSAEMEKKDEIQGPDYVALVSRADMSTMTTQACNIFTSLCL